ncbi:MAG: PAS domain S-box protein [Ignavibacteria bacterium]|nr:PAS domain S-box protein [Ignavibacteria bacterium]
MATEIKILFVEISPADIKLIKRTLSKKDIVIQPYVVENEIGFLYELEKFIPDIIIAGYDLPQYNGMSVLKIAVKNNPTIPFILLTDSMDESFAIECIKSGASDFIIKKHISRLPFAIKSILEKNRTLLQKSEQNIIEVQMMLQRVINLLPVRVFWKDLDLNYLGCNELFAKDAGKNAPEELLGKDDYQMDWNEQAELYRSDDQKIITSGKPKINFEEPQTNPAGEKIWLRTSKVPLTNFDGDIIGVLGTYEDNTRHRKLERSIQHQLIYAVTLNEIAQVIISTEDKDVILQKMNMSIGKALNVDRCMIYNISFETEQIVGLCEWLNPIHPDTSPTIGRYPLKTFSGGANQMMKTKKWLESHSDKINPSFFEDGSGEILHQNLKIQSLLWYPFAFFNEGYQLIALNSTHSKREWTKEEIDFLDSVSKQVSIALEKISLLEGKSKSERLLIEQSQILRTILDNSPIGIWMLDEKERMKFVNKTFCDAVGIPEEKFLSAKHYSELYDKVTAQNCIISDEAALQLESPHISFESVKFVDGQLHDLEIIKRKVSDTTGNKLGLVGISIDITKRKLTEAALFQKEKHSQSLVRLSKRLELSQTFSEVISAVRTEIQLTIGYKSSWIYLMSDDKNHFKIIAASGPASGIALSEEGAATLTIKGDRMLEEIANAKGIVIVEDAQSDPRTNKEIVAETKNRTILNIPIILFDKNIGTLGTGTFGDEGTRIPTKPEQEFLTAVASSLAVTIDRIQLLIERKKAEAQIFKLNRIYAVLSNINQAIVRIHDKQELLNEVCRIAVEFGLFRMVWIGLIDPSSNKVNVGASYGFTGDYLEKINIDLNNELQSSGPTGQAIKSGKHKISNNIETDETMQPWLANANKYSYKSSASFPLIVFNKVVGAMSIYSDEINFFEKEDVDILDEMALDISFAFEFIETENNRKIAEQAFIEKSEELELYFTKSLDLLCIADTDGYFHRLNPVWETTLGYSLKEIESRKFLDLVHPDDLEPTLQAIASLDEQKENLHFTNRYLCKDGSYRWIEWNSFPSGKLIYAVARDITERKLVEQERLANLHFLQSIDKINRVVQKTKDLEEMMISVLDTVISIFDCDRAFLFYPCDPNADTWKVPMERTKPEYPGAKELNTDIPMTPDIALTLQETLESDEPIAYQFGTPKPINKVSAEQFAVKSMVLIALYPKVGKPWVFGMHQCSAPRTWTNEESTLFKEISRRLSDALTGMLSLHNLQESEARFRRLAENAQDIIYRMSIPEGKYEYISPAVLTMTGFFPEEYYANPALFYNSVHPDWQKYLEDEWLSLLEGKVPDTYEYQIVHKSGEVRWFNQRNILVKDDKENPISIEGIVTDITERKRNESINASRLFLLQFSAAHSLDELLEETLNQAETLTGSTIGFYHFVEDDQKTLTLQNWSTRTKSEFYKAEGKGLHYSIDEAGVWVECVYQGKPVIHNDYNSLPNRKGLPEVHAEVIRELVVPVKRGNKIKAILHVVNKPTDYNEKDVEAISLIADLAWEIGERKLAEDALTASELEFRNLAESSPGLMGTFYLRPDGSICMPYTSPQIQNLFGVSSEEVVEDAAPLLARTHPDDIQKVKDSIAESAKTMTHWHCEYRVLHPTRGELWLEGTTNPKPHPNGGIIWYGFIHDITERKKAEKRLTLLNFALNHVSEAAFLIDEKACFQYVNENACHILGYTNDELLKMHVYDIDPEYTHDKWPSHWNELKINKTFTFEGNHKTKEGRIFPVEINANYLEFDGYSLNMALVRDISERKLMENALFFVAQRGWSTGKDNFFNSLVQFLGEKMEMDYVIIDKLDENPEIAETIALYAKGSVVPNIRYSLKGTPCENVMGKQLCIYTQNVQQQFPEDTLLAQMGVESYIGIPLWDSTGKPIGLIALMNSKPVSNDTTVTQILQLVATRAAAEMEREQSETILRKREYEFRTLAGNLPDNIIRYDLEGRTVYLNPTLEKTLGIDIQHMIGLTVREIHPKGSYETYAQALDEALSKGVNNEMELILPESSEDPIVHQIRMIVEHDELGEVTGILAIGRDITERKREEAINASRLHLMNFAAIHSFNEFIEESLNEIEKFTNSKIAFYVFVEEDQQSLFLQDWSSRTKSEFCKAVEQKLHYNISDAGVWIDSVIQRKAVIHNDYASLPNRKGLPEGHAELIRELVVPVFRGDKIKAVVAVGNKATNYTDSDVEAVSLLAGLSWEIAERKRSEQSLKESERRLSEAQQLANIGYWERDFITNKIILSDESCRIFGLASEDFPKKLDEWHEQWLQLILPEDMERTKNAALDAVQNDIIYNVDYRIIRPDGDIRYIHSEAEVRRDSSGKPLTMLGMMQDITKRKHAEEEILKLNRIYAVLSNINQAIVRIPDTKQLFEEACHIAIEYGKFDMVWVGMVNSESKKIEVTASQGMSEYYASKINICLNDEHQNMLPPASVISSGSHIVINNIELEESSIDGTEKYLKSEFKSFAAFPIIVNKKIVGVLNFYTIEADFFHNEEIKLLDEMVTDISFSLEFLENETERKRAEEALLESEKRYRLIAENTADTIAVFDMNLQYTYISPAVINLLGYTPNELMELSLEKIVSPDSWQSFLQTLKEEMELENSKKADPSRSRIFITEQLCKDGRKIWVEGSTSFIRDQTGKPINVLAISKNVTERKLAELALLKSEERYRNLYENAPIGFYRTTPNGTILMANKVLVKMLGHKSFEELKKRNLETEGYEPSYQRKQFVEKIERDGEIIDFESKWIRLDGGALFVRESAKAVRNDQGVTLYYDGKVEDVSERKRAEEALLESEDRYRDLVENSNELICAHDLKGAILMSNHAAAKNTGYTIPELLKMNIADLLVPEYRRFFKYYLNKINSEGKAEGLMLIQTKNGLKRIWQYNNSLRTIGVDEPIVRGMARDITEQKQNETALIESEERFRSVAQSANDAIITADSKGIILGWNKGAERIFGYLEAEAEGKELKLIIPQSYVKEHIMGMKRLEQGGEHHIEGQTIELHGKHKSGKEFPLELSLAGWETTKGRFFTGIIRDITERKKIENELRNLSRAIEQNPVGVVITNLDGNIEYANPKVLETSGYSFEELIGQNPRIFSSGNKPKEEYKELWSTINSGKEWRGEFHNKKKNGELYWVSALISPIFGETGKIIRFLAIQENITEKKKMIGELIKAKEKAEEMNRLKSNFLANMSHELRTPLNGILGYASILTSSLDNPEYNHMTQSIFSSGKRLSETLNLILDLSRAETDAIEVFSKNINIVPIINNVIELYTESAFKKNLPLRSVISDENLFANLDENLFERTISNLVSNAIKFTEKGRITIEAGRETSGDKNWIYINVKDTGIGIPEDKIDMIWEEFRQVSEGISRNFEGTGLGLTLSKRIIELMKGIITVESKVGVGSVFTIKFLASDDFPMAEELKPEKELFIKKDDSKIDTTSLLSILYVEDDLINQNVVKLYLRNNFLVETAKDGKTALQLIKKKKFDIFLMDINLGGGMDGMEITKLIRKMPQYSETPIVAVTAYALESDKIKFLAGGCSHYLSKPFEKHQLLDLISAIGKNRVNR